MSIRAVFQNSFKNIGDLAKQLQLENFSQNINEKRRSIKILVIDDKEFPASTNLSRNRYNITQLNDIDSIEVVLPYQIILCDLQGVGTKLNPELQGAHLVKEIKKNYPEKIVVAYTGGSSSDLIESSIKLADSYQPKDASIDDWISLLDNFIKDLSNPVYVWSRIRYRLLDAGISPYQLAVLEHDFVTNYNKSEDALKKTLESKIEEFRVSKETKAIIRQMIVGITRLYIATHLAGSN